MATYTTNLNLIKPDYEDQADIADLNDNFEIIDTSISNLGRSTLREVNFSIPRNSWAWISNRFQAEYDTSYVTTTSKDLIEFDSSLRGSVHADVNVQKKVGGGGLVFSTSIQPTSTLSGRILIFDNDDGKIPVLIESTVISVENGGTNASNALDARTNLGLGDAATANLANNLTTATEGYALDARQAPALLNLLSLKLLWTNPSPTSSMLVDDLIELSSDDYDLLYVLVRGSTTSSGNFISQSLLVPKGYVIRCNYSASSSNALAAYVRTLYYVNDTTYQSGQAQRLTSSGATDVSSYCLPLQIYGIKLAS